MARITLNSDQALIYSSADMPIEVCDTDGKVLGRIIPPILEKLIAECKRRSRSGGPRYSTDQVKDTLKTLEETLDKEGSLDNERLQQLLAEIRSKRGSL